jgi:hypothetical protein
MATPAATLQILVDAQTRTATSKLSKLDRQLRGVDATTATATTRTSQLGKASGTAGKALGRAARAAGGAALAYLSISQAKSAISTTQELTKSTLGLVGNLGMAEKTAGQWSAAARARGVDTKKLGMGFKTLSSQVEGALSGTETSMKLFEGLGISMKELKEGQTDVGGLMLQIADGTDKAGAGTERLNTISKLFGRSYQGLAPLIRDGREELEGSLAATEKYGSAIHGKVLDGQSKLRKATIESTDAWQGLQVTFTEMITPALLEAHDSFQKISKIMASDKLTNTEKFEKVGSIIGRWADKALDLFVGILPKMVKAATNRAPEIAKALIEGFMGADVWGKVLVGGWLFAKLGGAVAFRNAGTKGGKVFGRGFVIGAIFALPLLIPEAFKLGKKLGHAIKRGLRDIDIVGDTAEMLEDLFGLVDKLDAKEAIQGVRDAARNGDLGMDAASEALRKAGVDAHKASKVIARAYGFAHDVQKNHGEKSKDIAEDTSKHVSKSAKDQADAHQEASRKGSKAQEQLARNSNKSSKRGAVDVIRNVGDMVGTVLGGYNRLGENTNKALKAFGAKPVNFVINSEGNKVGTSGLARGGPINDGKPSGDSVPALLEKGEYVLNRNAVKGIGKDRLDAINFGHLARFQVGGGLQPGVSRLAKFAADKYGLSVSSGVRPGTGSLHNTGEAVDLVPPGMAATKGIFAAFKNQLAELFYDPWGGWNDGSMIGPIGGHMDHIHAAILGAGTGGAMMAKLKRLILKGPKGPLRSMGQGGLDKVWKGAKSYLSKHAMTSHGDIGNISGPLQGIAQKMIADQWGMGQWPFFNDLVMRESGWDPTAVNASSGAAGLAQALPPSKYPPGAWPYTGKSSAVKQLQWMISYIQGRYGNPAGAIAWHNSHNWYQKGGQVPFVGSYAQGGTIPRDGMARVHKGETISPAGTPKVEVNLYGSMNAVLDEVDVLIDGRKADIADYTMREGGRNRSRGRQLGGRR